MIDRREFMKLFGVGCAVVPLVGGIPVGAAESKLIEVPKIALAESPSLSHPAELMEIGLNGLFNTTVIFEGSDGRKTILSGGSFITRIEFGIAEMKLDASPYTHRYPTRRRLKYTLEGEFIANSENELLTMTQYRK